MLRVSETFDGTFSMRSGLRASGSSGEASKLLLCVSCSVDCLAYL